MSETYTDRYIEWQTVTRIYPGAVTGSSGFTAGCPASGMAKALARQHAAGRSLRDTVSALSPLTGDAFYEGREANQ